MKVYIAAPFELRKDAEALQLRLQDDGITVTARWIMEEGADQISHEWATNDLSDVARADILLLLNPPEFKRSGTGGRHVEFGYALALNKKVLVVGVASNIFHSLNNVVIVPQTANILQELVKL